MCISRKWSVVLFSSRNTKNKYQFSLKKLIPGLYVSLCVHKPMYHYRNGFFLKKKNKQWEKILMWYPTGIIFFIIDIKFQLWLFQIKSEFVPVSFPVANIFYFMSHKKYRVCNTNYILKNQVFTTAFPLFCMKSFVSIFLSEHINFQQEWNVNWCYAQAGLSFLKFNKKKKNKPNWVSCFYLWFSVPSYGGSKYSVSVTAHPSLN